MTEHKKHHDLLHSSGKSDDETTPNDQINDAVEAAVMKIVNGTFDTTAVEPKKKRKHADEEEEEEDYAFAQWTGFLDDKFMNADTALEEPAGKKKRKSDKSDKKKKKKKKKDKKHRLQKHKEGDEKEEAQVEEDEVAEKEVNDEPAAAESDADVFAEEPETTEPEPVPEPTPTRKSTKTPKPRKKSEPKEQLELPKLDFSKLNNIDSLVEEVSSKTSAWYDENVTPEERNKPRSFSPEEESLMAYYFAGYCHLHDMTRDDLCTRVWSSERKTDHFWKRCYQIFPYRTQSSIYKHIRRKFHVFDVRAIWTPEEDKKLDDLALLHNNKWKQIGEILGRMPEDCRDRWRNYVKCGTKRTMNKWSQEEEDQLIRIVTELMTQLTNSQVVDTENQLKNINWTIVSEKMNGLRSRIQCRYKWKKIANEEVKHRVSKMPDSTIDWLLRKIKAIGYRSMNGIDWDGLTQHYFRDHSEEEVAQDPYKWGSFDFKEIAEQIRLQHKGVNFGELIDQLTDGLVPRAEEYSLLRDK
ncbi:DNA-binding protein REB1 [Candida viswanathii]|uniref:DNA-binding protein REB1 n=1 Tax=Candida viswanathii TaxID=5486 RepID=A0A367XXD3_9ASCO|nr:DNA-binding protein REB1 [Candida viswanathii]